MSASLKQLSASRCFTGVLHKYQHQSTSTKTTMTFNIYLPDSASTQHRLPALYWLSGLTCTEDNFAQKATIGFKAAAAANLAVIIPDTSPRGAGIDGEDKDSDFGTGAGFYVNATVKPWSSHYRMYDYVTAELPALIEKELPVDGTRKSIFGHSMGGHGALSIFLRNPGAYRSVSAFSPIANPTNCAWGKKAFTGYLGEDAKELPDGWSAYDSTMLVKVYNNLNASKPAEILIDQGTGDSFYKQGQLLPENFVEAASGNKNQVKVNLRMHEGYGHDYYFISTFVEDHVNHHAQYLNAGGASSS